MIAAPFEKTYLSRAQSRIWSMENPVGDPFGGPAYGEKREPVSLIAAVVAIGVGASTVAAATTITLAAVMGGLMIAGGAAAAIGAVSGNKQLTMIGGLVAGVGGLGLGAANMFAEAAASTTALSSTGGDAIASGMSNSSAVAGGAAPYGTGVEAAYANPANLAPAAGGVDASQIVNMPSVGSFQTPTVTPTLTEATASAGGAAPYGTSIESNYSNPGLINSAAGESIGSAADLGGAVVQPTVAANPVDSITNELTTQFANAAENPLQSSPYESLADASGNTQLVPKPGTDMSKYVNDPNYIEALNGTPPQTPDVATQIKLGTTGDYGVTTKTGQVLDSSGKYIGQAPGFEVAGKPTVTGATTLDQAGSNGGNWLDKIEGIAKGIEKYKTTANLGGNLISGAMRYAVPSQLDQATIDAYNAKANLANAEANALAAAEERRRRQNESVKNMGPVQLNNASNPIFGNALNGAGIINSARA